ncbi:YihY/virulence factor BrkB family protein [Clostridium oryzae]|uniref:Uncharacterized protein n=1 Tax=Clostridium oryzae TaxID=1450648 RepID=A0A1V4IYW1_9CLOT|nr:YihY/virulence factor BrkB family protein [Clostridium oryzae]OPJ65089.1 hypothetical protein CLORY_00890 [Clostridium oryzae]
MNKKLHFISLLIKRYKEDELAVISSRIAYSLLLSFIPLLIFLLTILGFTHIKSGNIMIYISDIVPKDVYQLISEILKEVVDTKRSNLLSFSLIATLWSASGGIKSIMWALNRAYDEKEKRGFIKFNLISLLFTIGIIGIVFISMIMVVWGNVIGQYVIYKLHITGISILLWNILRYLIVTVFMFIIFISIYYYLPCRRQRFRDIVSGTLFSTIGWILSSFAFSYYVDNYANYSRVYGSIASIFILMLWFYISSIILLLGGEINAVLLEAKKRNTI